MWNIKTKTTGNELPAIPKSHCCGHRAEVNDEYYQPHQTSDNNIRQVNILKPLLVEPPDNVRLCHLPHRSPDSDRQKPDKLYNLINLVKLLIPDDPLHNDPVNR